MAASSGSQVFARGLKERSMWSWAVANATDLELKLLSGMRVPRRAMINGHLDFL